MSSDDPLESLTDDPAKPVALYRGPALTLFRGWTLVGLVVVCVGAGALGRGVADDLLARVRATPSAPPAPPAPPASPASPAPPAPPPPTPPPAPSPSLTSAPGPRVVGTLRAHAGGATRFPTGVPSLVNVWLQGCADCMPAFTAWRDLRASGRLPAHVNVINVAYGSADKAWAAGFDVAEGLHVDDGAVFVQPLGISSFTTLLLDHEGVVRLRDRPDAPGFADRVTGALRVLWSDRRVPREVAARLPGSPRSSTPSSSTTAGQASTPGARERD